MNFCAFSTAIISASSMIESCNQSRRLSVYGESFETTWIVDTGPFIVKTGANGQEAIARWFAYVRVCVSTFIQVNKLTLKRWRIGWLDYRRKKAPTRGSNSTNGPRRVGRLTAWVRLVVFRADTDTCRVGWRSLALFKGISIKKPIGLLKIGRYSPNLTIY